MFIKTILLPFVIAFIATKWIFPKALNIALEKNIVDNPSPDPDPNNPTPPSGTPDAGDPEPEILCAGDAAAQLPQLPGNYGLLQRPALHRYAAGSV